MKKLIIVLLLLCVTSVAWGAEFNYDKLYTFLDKYQPIFGEGVTTAKSYLNTVAPQINDNAKYKKLLVIQMLNANYLVIMQRLEGNRNLVFVHYYIDAKHTEEYEDYLRQQLKMTRMYAMEFSHQLRNALNTMEETNKSEDREPYLLISNAVKELKEFINEIKEFSFTNQ
ncbi:MAG: hypothetical protein ISS47_06585 [Candidatus Omnitrophica bacterium]|nr:hypothetical protein [Candidatus Omnitrophota bacterium]